MKTLEQNFIDWEATAIGYGYGSGEPFVLPSLYRFMALCPPEGCYEYRVLETELGGAVFWLLVSLLCRADILEYGTSPRAAWLTTEGRKLQRFILSKTPDLLIDLVCDRRSDDYCVCYQDACNCGPNGYQEGVKCPNPFWPHRGS